MTQTPRRNLVIVGGGTAGWMAASYLNRFLVRKGWQITLVESPDIGTIGVGEATIPSLVRFLRAMDFDEDVFMRRCAATYKLGIAFTDWFGHGHRYFHPFGICGSINGLDLFHFWMKHRIEGQATEAYTDYSLQSLLADEAKGPRQHGADSPIMRTGTYAFHLDAGAFAQFLKEVATAEGVRHLFGEVRAVRRDPWGDIAAIDIGGGRELAGDLFIDCTGFRGLLIEETLGDPWIDWGRYLLCDRAVVMPLPREDDPLPYTRSTALDAGWMWQIPLSTRTGNGYVYSSQHASPDQAAQALIDRADLRRARSADPRHLKMRIGRRGNGWVRNCVAVGLASGFVEPLESTGIHLIQRALELLVDNFPAGDRDDLLRAAYNRRMQALYEEVRDFIVLHYVLTDRVEPFWRDARSVAIPDTLQDSLDAYEMDGRMHLTHSDIFSETNHHFILAGNGRLPRRPTARVDFTPLQPIVPVLRQIREQNRAMAASLPSHRALIAAINANP
ncbi:tryptophan 7-halogenase [Methylobacterium sp. J-059]|uniref:tryptophan halogenase family protein n=1 Tax=Methylobacterium sp. J-059 TaxID=2836643 RepID=UPI001FBA94A7|nr:tryptophan halogenase family protein [Methylobacterium sp. J-059]MCJ2038378.1 tryptophan 7-halogenase [Methylobacterium sp. J-059]